MESLSLIEIDGIGKTKAEKLKEVGVSTVRQLYDIVDKNPDDKRIKSVKKCSVYFHELLRERPVLEKNCLIDQFVLGLDTKLSKPNSCITT